MLLYFEIITLMLLSIALLGIVALYIYDFLRERKILRNIKSPGAVATGVQQLARRGHPGNVIKCVETGEVFASQNRAAAAYGISAKALRNSLRGLKETAGGYHFEFVGEMPATAGTVVAS